MGMWLLIVIRGNWYDRISTHTVKFEVTQIYIYKFIYGIFVKFLLCSYYPQITLCKFLTLLTGLKSSLQP